MLVSCFTWTFVWYAERKFSFPASLNVPFFHEKRRIGSNAVRHFVICTHNCDSQSATCSLMHQRTPSMRSKDKSTCLSTRVMVPTFERMVVCCRSVYEKRTHTHLISFHRALLFYSKRIKIKVTRTD